MTRATRQLQRLPSFDSSAIDWFTSCVDLEGQVKPNKSAAVSTKGATKPAKEAATTAPQGDPWHGRGDLRASPDTPACSGVSGAIE